MEQQPDWTQWTAAQQQQEQESEPSADDTGMDHHNKPLTLEFKEAVRAGEDLNAALRSYFATRLISVSKAHTRRLLSNEAMGQLRRLNREHKLGLYVITMNSQNEALLGLLIARLGIQHLAVARAIEALESGGGRAGMEKLGRVLLRHKREVKQIEAKIESELPAAVKATEELHMALANYLRTRMFHLVDEERRALLSERIHEHLSKLKAEGHWLFYLATLNNQIELMAAAVVARLAARRLLLMRGAERWMKRHAHGCSCTECAEKVMMMMKKYKGGEGRMAKGSMGMEGLMGMKMQGGGGQEWSWTSPQSWQLSSGVPSGFLKDVEMWVSGPSSQGERAAIQAMPSAMPASVVPGPIALPVTQHSPFQPQMMQQQTFFHQ